MRMIEKAKKEDYKQIQSIAHNCFKKTIAQDKMLLIAGFLVKNYFKAANIDSRLTRNYDLFVLKKDEIVIGFIEIQDKKHITNIFILENQQRNGYGKKLIEFAINFCRENGTNEITLEAIENAVRFYSKMGFKSLDRMKKTFGVTTLMMKIEI